MKSVPSKILGIDPGLATVGLGLVDAADVRNPKALDWLTITTPAGLPTPDRLKEIATDLGEYLDSEKPDLVVIERLFFATNRQTAIDVAQARGAILLTVAQRSIPLLEPTPLQLKMAITNDGSADKRQVQDMVVRILKLNEIPQPDVAADALALALYGTYARTSLAGV